MIRFLVIPLENIHARQSLVAECKSLSASPARNDLGNTFLQVPLPSQTPDFHRQYIFHCVPMRNASDQVHYKLIHIMSATVLKMSQFTPLETGA